MGEVTDNVLKGNQVIPSQNKLPKNPSTLGQKYILRIDFIVLTINMIRYPFLKQLSFLWEGFSDLVSLVAYRVSTYFHSNFCYVILG